MLRKRKDVAKKKKFSLLLVDIDSHLISFYFHSFIYFSLVLFQTNSEVFVAISRSRYFFKCTEQLMSRLLLKCQSVNLKFINDDGCT